MARSKTPSPDADVDSIPVPETMRALVLNGVGFEHLSVRTIPTPRPEADQILARVDAAGICTSLIKLVEQGPAHALLHGWDIRKHPIILGDEGAVTLVEVGENLGVKYRPGERYVIQPAVDHAPIRHQERYQNGARGVAKIAVGYTLPGHLAEYVLIGEEVLAAGCLLPMPDASLPAAHAAMSEPLSCVISAQDHHLHLYQESPSSPRETIKGLRRGGVTVIFGAGAMGRMHVDMALSYKPRAVVSVDFLDDRLERVRNLFGERALDVGVALHTSYPGDEAMQLVHELTDHRGADDVIVAVGSARAVEMAQRFAGRGAVLDIFGGLKKGEDIIELDTGIVHYKEINVTGSSGGSPWDIASTLILMAQEDLDAGAHITRIGDLDHAIELIELVRERRIDGKAVVYPHRRCEKVLEVPSWSEEDELSYLGAVEE